MVKRIASFLIVLLAGLLAFLLWQDHREQQQNEKHLTALADEVQPLDQKRQELQSELTLLEKEYEARMEGVSMEELLITELDAILYTDMYPLTQEYQVTGVLALSQEQFPDQEGKISREQFNELINNGWSYCLSWSGEGDLSVWLTGMQEQLKAAGLAMPEVLYFQSGAYSMEADSIIQGFGISIAVHHGEEDLPYIITESEEGIWHPGSYPWNTSGIRDVIDGLVNDGGNLAFTVSFNQEKDIYKDQSFRIMLEYIADYRANEQLLVTDFLNARSCMQNAENGNVELKTELETKKAEIQLQIEELKQQIEEIYSKYDVE